ncbi:hypothetical protein GRJ2_000715200 [Grus japonensis]|uniref:Uncharacterized protein n=1 Tax=Grus japonensis TaxID=30415 RepID=A0ABC9WCG6_GRUJA
MCQELQRQRPPLPLRGAAAPLRRRARRRWWRRNNSRSRRPSCLAPCAGGCTVTLRSVHYLTGKGRNMELQSLF